MGGLAFRTLGGDAGPDVVLIHGFGSDRLSWLGNLQALTPLARVHALDLPGHGESAIAADGSPAALAEAVTECLAAEGIGPAHLVAHSLGGAIAMLMAERQPEQILSLSLIAPLGHGIDRDFLQRYPEMTETEETTSLLHRLVSRPQLINKLTVKRVQEQLARPGTRDSLRRIAAAVIASEAAMAETATRIAAGSIPRLTLWGQEDSINPPDADALCRFGGTRIIIPDAGHLPHIEAAKQVNAALADFLAAQGR